MALSSRNCQTLCAIFEAPTRVDVRWDEFVRLCRALGAEFPKPGRTSGSRRRIRLRGRRAVFHEPHRRSTMAQGSVEAARDFLRTVGVTPKTEGCQC